MKGKLISLFKHPEYLRRAQARAERELAEKIASVPPYPPDVDPPEFDLIEAFLEQLSSEK